MVWSVFRCVLLTDGNVKCFGKNYAGQLGLDDTEIRGDEENEMGDNLSTVYLGGQQATAIACGEEHRLVPPPRPSVFLLSWFSRDSRTALCLSPAFLLLWFSRLLAVFF